MDHRDAVTAVLLSAALAAAGPERQNLLLEHDEQLRGLGARSPGLLALVLRDRLGGWRPDDVAVGSLTALGFTFPEPSDALSIVAAFHGMEDLPESEQLHRLEQARLLWPCGHVLRVAGCGGCDPSAIELVVEEDTGRVRAFDPERDLARP